jgi:hypothetical protein
MSLEFIDILCKDINNNKKLYEKKSIIKQKKNDMHINFAKNGNLFEKEKHKML